MKNKDDCGGCACSCDEHTGHTHDEKHMHECKDCRHVDKKEGGCECDCKCE
ncbi:MAG TPA: hypothetical protein VJH96_00815 [Patescibacteria group bacterium]|nr:hypothetical protein [Patescibacteria group bacterium]